MPPTPFQPTHQTPFKSTVSSSQQSRVHHTPYEDEPSTQISISDIDPFEWKYHAEGGKNVLLSFVPSGGNSPFVTSTCTYALRIPKSHPSEAQPEDQEEEAEQFTNNIIVPLLGSPSVLPKCIRIPILTPRDRHIIDILSARIEMQRPASRRAHPARIRAESLSCIYAVEDVTAPSASSSKTGVLCVEIKPKWGFLPRLDSIPPSSPNVEVKARFSRYRMHRVLKDGHMSKVKFEELYDPLDLYSTIEKRKVKAIRALWRDWKETKGKTNNLRLFWNGAVVDPDDTTTLNDVAQFLGAQSSEDEEALLRALSTQLIAELSKPTLPNTAGEQDASTVLTRLSHLQASLDPLDVEGLSQLWLHHTQSHTLGQLLTTTDPASLPAALTSALPVSQLYFILEQVLTTSSTAEVKLEDALQAFLVSASFKDCSMLIRFSRTPIGEGGKFEGETKLVDLDRKPFEKLESMQKTDGEVCAAFLAWLGTLSSAPEASIAP
ncbi:probable Inositol-pentakisphosphate 2-kinase [Ustilago trichophora]|uniref:Inositol-pentakisphosphate 2-kinase n=1 Tax=Ustilago trichophora TaxID=86804 RepID=A0A5C3E3F3_9BASI|nr:probable Inositol-pentakisphosphate 2-kinase [Ustilago trichophora]